MKRLDKIKFRDTMIRARATLQTCLDHGVDDTNAIKRRISELTKAIVDLAKIPEDN